MARGRCWSCAPEALSVGVAHLVPRRDSPRSVDATKLLQFSIVLVAQHCPRTLLL